MGMTPGIITPDNFKGLPVQAFFTTKSYHGEIGRLHIELHAEAVYLPLQKHTDKIIIAEYDLEPKVADAVVTGRRGLVIGIKVADCVPVLLFDKRKHIAGAVHAGWRGTAEGILKKTIAIFRNDFHSSPADIMIAIGPSIKGCCYVVGPEVVDAVYRETGKGEYVLKRGESRFVDLGAANRQQALLSGILSENVWLSGDCTHCLPQKYYSYRYAKGVAGRQYGFIVIP
jgi:YfiH family protein